MKHIFVLLLSLCTLSAFSATFTFTLGASGNWSDATNWDVYPGTSLTSTDLVIILGFCTIDVPITNDGVIDNIIGLTIQADVTGSGTLENNQFATITLAGGNVDVIFNDRGIIEGYGTIDSLVSLDGVIHPICGTGTSNEIIINIANLTFNELIIDAKDDLNYSSISVDIDNFSGGFGIKMNPLPPFNFAVGDQIDAITYLQPSESAGTLFENCVWEEVVTDDKIILEKVDEEQYENMICELAEPFMIQSSFDFDVIDYCCFEVNTSYACPAPCASSCFTDCFTANGQWFSVVPILEEFYILPVGLNYEVYAGCGANVIHCGNPAGAELLTGFIPNETYYIKVWYPDPEPQDECATVLAELRLFYELIVPVELSHFSGVHLDQKNKLSWTSQSEVSSDYYELQYSTNSRDFTALDKVYIDGDSNTERSYEYIHENPSKENYYRLKIVDFDGDFSYSDVVYIKSANSDSYNVYPNPASNILYVAGLDKSQQVSIKNLTGQIVYQGNYTNGINLQQFQSGLFFLNIDNDDRWIKFVVE